MACFYDYTFESIDKQNAWRCILNNTFESMELYYRKQFSMPKLLSYFKKAFRITSITLKKSTDDALYKHKLLGIYLLVKYSQEEFEIIAKEFNTSLETINLISSNNIYRITYRDEIRVFFKQFENDYLIDRKSSLAFQESVELAISRQSNVNKI